MPILLATLLEVKNGSSFTRLSRVAHARTILVGALKASRATMIALEAEFGASSCW